MRAYCGYAAFCGRNAGHRGPHGGFRRTASPSPQPASEGGTLAPMNLRCLAEYALHGDYRAAADCMGMAYQSYKNRMCSSFAEMGVHSAAEAMYALGWIVLPAGTYHAEGEPRDPGHHRPGPEPA